MIQQFYSFTPRPVPITQPDIWLAELRLTRFESLSASDVKGGRSDFRRVDLDKKFFSKFK